MPGNGYQVQVKFKWLKEKVLNVGNGLKPFLIKGLRKNS